MIRRTFAAALAVIPAVVGAQSSARWHGSASLNATALFGATTQRVIGSSTRLSRADSSLEASVGFQFKYGEAAGEDRNNFVTSRSWLFTMAADPFPFATLAPFVFGTAESSLEKQIARRFSGGAGVKWTFVQSERGDASVSLAMLGEHTTPRPDTKTGVANPATDLARWSARLKFKRKVQERLTLEHVSFYQPVVNDFNRYLVTTTSEAVYKISDALGFRLSLVDNYDADALRRGARANNDGQFLVGLQASF